MRKLFLIFVIALFGLSCSNSVDNAKKTFEKVVERNTNNTPKIVYYYEVQGTDTTWVKEAWFHDNGNLNLEGAIVNNKREGKWESYYPTGELMSVGNFKNGLREGRGVIFFKNGNTSIDVYYHEGKQCGVWTYFNEDGIILSVEDKDPE